MSLIEREKLIEHLNAFLAESDGETPITDAVLVAIRCAVEQMPEVDAAPVIHGHWKLCAEDWRNQMEGDECSVCGFQHYGSRYNYCRTVARKWTEARYERML